MTIPNYDKRTRAELYAATLANVETNAVLRAEMAQLRQRIASLEADRNCLEHAASTAHRERDRALVERDEAREALVRSVRGVR